jgi:hypothetical protein
MVFNVHAFCVQATEKRVFCGYFLQGRNGKSDSDSSLKTKANTNTPLPNWLISERAHTSYCTSLTLPFTKVTFIPL